MGAWYYVSFTKLKLVSRILLHVCFRVRFVHREICMVFGRQKRSTTIVLSYCSEIWCRVPGAVAACECCHRSAGLPWWPGGLHLGLQLLQL